MYWWMQSRRRLRMSCDVEVEPAKRNWGLYIGTHPRVILPLKRCIKGEKLEYDEVMF